MNFNVYKSNIPSIIDSIGIKFYNDMESGLSYSELESKYFMEMLNDEGPIDANIEYNNALIRSINKNIKDGYMLSEYFLFIKHSSKNKSL